MEKIPTMPMPQMPAPTEGLAATQENKPVVAPKKAAAPVKKAAAPVKVEALVDEAPVHTGPIRVVALREGFNRGQRIKEGDVFQLESIELLGSWMKLI